ncbi:hypothetical protein RGQ29_014881 [Quercus rubra]|uniref:Uncharacterized protein n=1 Tax=Quercus rubra TaxID=3512 RepID=A0AAN7FMW0_QUERU|nr:hypothetical protein RGQ29_014881 [Quercus rubra]
MFACSSFNKIRGHIVVELSDLDNEVLVKLVGGDLVQTVVAHDVIGRLMIQCARPRQPGLAQFAVGYNRRGIEETELKIVKDTSNGSDKFALLDRNKCFGVVAAAVKGAVSDSVVDLKSPEFSVLVELLPLSGVPNGSLVVAVLVLPQNLINTKPHLCIKALVSDSKAKGGKH